MLKLDAMRSKRGKITRDKIHFVTTSKHPAEVPVDLVGVMQTRNKLCFPLVENQDAVFEASLLSNIRPLAFAV